MKNDVLEGLGKAPGGPWRVPGGSLEGRGGLPEASQGQFHGVALKLKKIKTSRELTFAKNVFFWDPRFSAVRANFAKIGSFIEETNCFQREFSRFSRDLDVH